jgi:hypothetical protein
MTSASVSSAVSVTGANRGDGRASRAALRRVVTLERRSVLVGEAALSQRVRRISGSTSA